LCPDLKKKGSDISTQTSHLDEDFGGRSWTASPVSSIQSSDLSFETANQYSSWNIEIPVTRKNELFYSESHLLKKPRRQAPCLDTRCAQNRAAQRAYRQRAALHLKAVEDELVSLKRKHGELMQRYEELNCWSNGLLSALMEKDPNWEAGSGITVS
jgi:hypothetical protein